MKPALAIEPADSTQKDGQILILVIKPMKQSHLLVAVGRIVEGVKVDGDLSRTCLKRDDELADENITHFEQDTGLDTIFKA